MLNMSVNMLKMIINLMKIPFYVLSVFSIILFLLIITNIIILRIKGMKFIKGVKRAKSRKRTVFQRLILDAPHMIAKDIIRTDPDFFKYQGMIIFVGRQGKGKTISMVHFMRKIQNEFPLAKCITNLKYKYQNNELGTWKQMVGYSNDKKGVIVGIDETQNWFSSNDSRNFPPQMLEEITQNRKQRRIILGTAQSFNRLAKPIREQTTEVRECITILKCITIVIKKEPILSSEGEVKEYKNRGMYFFVHSDELRESYDTWHTIKKLIKSGFRDKDYLLDDSSKINLKIEK